MTGSFVVWSVDLCDVRPDASASSSPRASAAVILLRALNHLESDADERVSDLPLLPMCRYLVHFKVQRA